ncbi:iron only hydrogenase large c-terminal domain-containing protein [Cystoisospora suis]|uniref:Iron only hydrogenase large c-terminal domain-containing protein n=1 Tax=Cystoisospora suis TaxID=483139 RepID=A0A2C6KMA2_9APIC|nr:iron only hydrogenase large c-terminal domain-containing protein [Cystoisospora suis]
MASATASGVPFSSALKLAELDDYLFPAQNCAVTVLSDHTGVEHKQVRARATRPDEVASELLADRARSGPPQPKNSASSAGGPRVTTGAKHVLDKIDRHVASGLGTAEEQQIRTATSRRARGGYSGRHSEEAGTVELSASPRPPASPAVAKVSLYDCLACSGCVTSAETVLLEQHSVDHFLQRESASSRSILVVSISLQSLTALSRHFGFSLATTLKKLSTLFRLAGASYVLHTHVSDALAVLEAEREFIRRYRATLPHPAAGHSGRGEDVPEKGRGLSPPDQLHASPAVSENRGEPRDTEGVCLAGHGPLPVLTSFCPGLVCYAEKSLDAALLPFFSRVRSGQQLQGLLVKGLLRESHNTLLFFLRWRAMVPVLLPFQPISLWLALLRHSPLTTSSQADVTSHPSTLAPADGPSRGFSRGSPVDSANAADTLECSTPKGVPHKAALDVWAEDLTPKDVYHVCVEPCFDKKLEAARPEFCSSFEVSGGTVRGWAVPETGRVNARSTRASGSTTRSSDFPQGAVPDVDLVLATNEVLTLIQRMNVTFADLDESRVDDFFPWLLAWQFNSLARRPPAFSTESSGSPGVSRYERVSAFPHPVTRGVETHGESVSAFCSPVRPGEDRSTSKKGLEAGHSRGDVLAGKDSESRETGLTRPSEFVAGSGGYAERVFRRAAWELFGVRVDGPLNLRPLRNEDYKEVALVVDGQEKLRFAIAYGFRNIQNVIQRLKRHVRQETSGRVTRAELRAVKSADMGTSDPPHAVSSSTCGDTPTLVSPGVRRRHPDVLFPQFIELAACPGGCLNGGGQALGESQGHRAPGGQGKHLVPPRRISGEGGGLEKPVGKDPLGDSDKEPAVGSTAAESKMRNGVDVGAMQTETREPLASLTELLHTSTTFVDALDRAEVHLAYAYLERCSSEKAGKAGGTEQSKGALRLDRTQAKKGFSGKGGQPGEGEELSDWWQEMLCAGISHELLYTDFKSVVGPGGRKANASWTSLRW